MICIEIIRARELCSLYNLGPDAGMQGGGVENVRRFYFCLLYRVNDIWRGGATAQISAHVLPNIGFGFRLTFLDASDGRDDLPWCAVSALKRVVIDEGLLHRMQHAARRASARGLAINTGQAKGEEFPLFKAFWIEKPAANANSIVVHALLDSERITAAYRFTIRPGDTTLFDVEMAIYPRVALDHAGLMPMTSMFFFGPNARREVDDFRPEVHDSDGVAIYNGRGAMAPSRLASSAR
jgi:glucan biosynthesis protein